jgi:N-acetylneuraminic acid mutarotase
MRRGRKCDGGQSAVRSHGLHLLLTRIGISVVLVFAACGEDSAQRADGAASAGGKWRSVPSLSKKAGFQELTGVRSSGRTLVVAGATYEADSLHILALDADAQRWRQEPSPLRWRHGYAAVGTPGGVFVWGGTSNLSEALADGAEFDLGERRWRKLPASPLAGRYDHTAVSTGDEVLVWGGTRNAVDGPGRGFRDGARYDRTQREWKRIEAAPIRGSASQAGVWAGDRLIAVSNRRAAAYDPRDDGWELLPQLPATVKRETELFWTGEDVLAWDGKALLVLARGTGSGWQRAAPFPGVARDAETAVWSDGTLYVWGGIRRGSGDRQLHDGAAYTASTDEWSSLPNGPLTRRDRHALAPKPNGFLVVGGCCDGNRYLNDGATFNSSR